MDVEAKAPKKGAGVPRETPGRNSLGELERLVGAVAPAAAGGLARRATEAGYFQAGLGEQFTVAARVMLDAVSGQAARQRLLKALLAHSDSRVRGYAAHLVPRMYEGDLAATLEGLKLTGAAEGSWVQELSQGVLHALAVEHGLEPVLRRVRAWVKDPDSNIRRLVVEALRPRGVMCAHIRELKEDPSPLRPMLAAVLDDPSPYVRKAVANNLNDISRDHPDVLLAWCQEWRKQSGAERAWVLERGLRTLLKNGNPQALQMLRFGGNRDVDARWVNDTPRAIQLNQFIPFELSLRNLAAHEVGVLINVIIEGPGLGNAGRRRSQFHLWKGRVGPGQERVVAKRIHFVDRNSQRKLPGQYRLFLSVNGQELENRQFSYE